MVTRERGSFLDLPSVAIAVVVLLIGGALGFAAGYRFDQRNDARAESKAAADAKAAQSAEVADAAKQENAKKVTSVLLKCLAEVEGVSYPQPPTNIAEPPAGVSPEQHKAALDTCGRRLLGGT